MSRAKWKGPYVDSKLLTTINQHNDYSIELFTTSRSSVIIPSFVGRTFNIHNGKVFLKIKVDERMLGKKLGEFVPTRKKFSFKKKKSK